MKSSMAHPLLQGPQRDARGGHLGTEGMPEIVEPHLAHPSGSQGPLVAPDERRVVQDLAGVRLGEDEVVIGLERRPLQVPLQLPRDPVDHRHRPGSAPRLRRSPMAADVVLSHPEP